MPKDNVPSKIYLQWHGSATPNEIAASPGFEPNVGDVTWSTDRQFDADIEYDRHGSQVHENGQIQADLTTLTQMSVGLAVWPPQGQEAAVVAHYIEQLRKDADRWSALKKRHGVVLTKLATGSTAYSSEKAPAILDAWADMAVAEVAAHDPIAHMDEMQERILEIEKNLGLSHTQLLE